MRGPKWHIIVVTLSAIAIIGGADRADTTTLPTSCIITAANIETQQLTVATPSLGFAGETTGSNSLHQHTLSARRANNTHKSGTEPIKSGKRPNIDVDAATAHNAPLVAKALSATPTPRLELLCRLII